MERDITATNSTNVDLLNMSVDDKLNQLLLRMDKIDKIDETVSSIDERLSKIEHDTQTLSDRLTQEINKRVELEQSVAGAKSSAEKVEESCNFLSDKYDKLLEEDATRKLEVTKNTTDISNLQAENVRLKQSIDGLKNEIEQNKIAQNREQQYHRTSLNIKLCGVPTQDGEDESKEGPSNPVTRDVIDLVCRTASITMKKDAIDVCHRLGRQGQGPIIIRFSTKSARCDFARQSALKLTGLTSAHLDFTKMKTRGVPAATPATTRSRTSNETTIVQPPDAEASNIYVQEHLTKYNKDLLTETRDILKDTHQYYGYVKNGEIRVKVAEHDKYTVISCKGDIQKELDRATQIQNGR